MCDTEKSLNNGVHVFISGLSLKAKEFDVESFFKGIGKARNTNLKQGYGFVEIEDARYAVYEMNNQPLCGGITTGESAKGFPYQKNFCDDRGGDNGDRGGGRGDYSRDDCGSFNDKNMSKYGPALRTSIVLEAEYIVRMCRLRQAGRTCSALLLEWRSRMSEEKKSWSSTLNKN